MKKVLVSMLVVCLCFSLVTPVAFAERYTNCAEALNSMGVFNGVENEWAEGGIDYELSRGATRAEALVMLIRLLGEEEAAAGCTLTHNFADVPADHWAYPYIAYAVDKGYTTGTTADSFEPEGTVRLKVYMTFLLRALGYSDANGDFSYDAAMEKAVEIGMLPAGTYGSASAFCLRDDCVYLSILALNTQMPHVGTTLAENLIAKGVIPADSAQKANDAAWMAGQELAKANLSPNPVKPENHLIYSEYEGDKVINQMEHIVYYNYFANTFYHYEYDENGRMVFSGNNWENWYESDWNKWYFQEKFHYSDDGVTVSVDVLKYDESSQHILKSEYDENNRLIAYDGMKISYEDNGEVPTAVIKGVSAEYFEDLEISIPDVEKIIVKDHNDKVEATLYYNAEGKLIKKTDEKDRLVYEAEYNEAGILQEETVRTYKWSSDSPVFNANSGVDSQSVYYYIYNENGSLYNVTIWTLGKDDPEEFIFRYFGNGKLDRILWRQVERNGETWGGEVWEQVNTAFDDQGHMKYPYN